MSARPHPAYDALAARQQRLHRLEHLQALATWDKLTQMPRGGAAARAAAQAEFSALLQGMRDDPAQDRELAAADDEDLAPLERRNLALITLERQRARALPPAQVAERERLSSLAQAAWIDARQANHWAPFAQALTPLVACVRDEAARLGDAFGLAPYDALLDRFEPGLRGDRLGTLFGEVAGWLPGLLQRATAAQAGRQVIDPVGPFPIERQKALSQRLMRALGFDFDAGRLDVSLHPFTGGVPEDVRLTGRYDEARCLPALLITLHESGHACYQQNLPREWLGQPLALPRSAALHEGQALCFERQLAPTAAFVSWLAPLLRETYGAQPAFEPDNLLALMTRVRPGPIRVEADELCYPAHVILRTRIEQALFAREIEVDDIPAHWEEGMRSLLGVDVHGDALRGPLQDVHWCHGMFGYFPAYLLGAMAAAQLFAALRRPQPDRPDPPGLDDSIARGDFSPVTRWLGDKVWSRGGSATGEELLQAATGAGYSPALLREHLERRYLEAAA